MEQITFLLFLKRASEMKGDLDAPQVPDAYSWEDLRDLTSTTLETQYRHTLEHPAKDQGLLGVIYRKQ